MNLSRRQALVGATVAGVMPIVSAACAAPQAPGSTLRLGAIAKPEMDGQLLVNSPRAYNVMDRFGLAGLVAANPINVYYLANTMPIDVPFRRPHSGFATLGRDESVPPFLISSIVSAFDMSGSDRETAALIAHGYDQPYVPNGKEGGANTEPNDALPYTYPVLQGAALTPREQAWADEQARVTNNDNYAANSAWGVARALKAQGVTNGRVGVDDMHVAELLKQTDLTDIECVPAYELFQLIRMVKSPQELSYQKIGGWNNGEACLATIRSIERGMTEQDVRDIFRLECAKRGNDMVVVSVGLPGGGFPDGVAVEGKPYCIDAVSHFRQYHGDTGRSFSIGELGRDAKQRLKANLMARDAVFDALKPGVKFSDLSRIGVETMHKMGVPKEAAFAGPHTVGLQHGDNPHFLPLSSNDPLDIALEENMVLTVDLPVLQIGWGQGHNEDLVRITKTGYELFSSDRDPYIVL